MRASSAPGDEHGPLRLTPDCARAASRPGGAVVAQALHARPGGDARGGRNPGGGTISVCPECAH
jgi:hypothetical protein